LNVCRNSLTETVTYRQTCAAMAKHPAHVRSWLNWKTCPNTRKFSVFASLFIGALIAFVPMALQNSIAFSRRL
jgi:hypothetical protein